MRPLRAKRVLFLSGAQDGCVPPAVAFQSAKDYQALGCQADFGLLAETPHNVMMDGRVKKAAQTLLQFAHACEER